MKKSEEFMREMASSHKKLASIMDCKQSFIKKQSKIADLWKLQVYYESRNETLKVDNVIDKIEKLVNVDSVDKKRYKDSSSGCSDGSENETHNVVQNSKQGSKGNEDEDKDVDGDVLGGYVEFDFNADENDDNNENDEENDDINENDENNKNDDSASGDSNDNHN